MAGEGLLVPVPAGRLLDGEFGGRVDLQPDAGDREPAPQGPSVRAVADPLPRTGEGGSPPLEVAHDCDVDGPCSNGCAPSMSPSPASHTAALSCSLA